MKKLALIAAAVAVFGTSMPAWADDASECAYESPTWNAPAGALVLNQSSDLSGPVGQVITSIGETYTHSAISHGPSWGSMNTMRTPGTWPGDGSENDCGHPVDRDRLANGWPGARTDPGPGLWLFYYGAGSQNKLNYQVASTGSCNYTNTASPWTCNTSTNSWGSNDNAIANATANYEQSYLSGSSGCGAGSPGPGCGVGWGPGHYGYSVYAYSSFNSIQSGDYGTMCAATIADAYWRAPTPNSIYSYTYSNGQVAAASANLYNTINSGIGSIGDLFGDVATCIACWDCNIKDEAADEVVQCFAIDQGGWCGDSDHGWSPGVYGHTATSVSPDRLGGWGAHYPTANTNNTSPWAPVGGTAVTFSGAPTYGCWY
jgi:hypothetical protein